MRNMRLAHLSHVISDVFESQIILKIEQKKGIIFKRTLALNTLEED